jgi:histidinol-phosphate aminotransferase
MLLTAATRLKSKAPTPTLVTTTPTFVMYRLSARVRGQRVMEVPLDDDWDVNEAALLKAVEMAQPNVLFLASPNNPTGTMVSEDRLERIIQGAPETLVVVDEAYIDYADRNQLALLEKYENVAILRTLSKVGFASLRVGWMAASKALTAEVDKVRLPYNLPTLSQDLATLVLTDYAEEIKGIAAKVVAERGRVRTELERLGKIRVVPSQANFLWLEVERPSGAVYTSLGKQGVLVRSFHGRGGRLEKYLRVTIGTRKENDRFLEALSESL